MSRILVLLAAVLSLFSGANLAEAGAPEHANYCYASYLGSADGTPTATAYCKHLDNGYWVKALVVCQDKWSTRIYSSYSIRTLSAWVNVYASCASGYYMSSYKYITGNY